MRKTFTMTKLQHAALLNAMRPVPAMWIGGPPRSVQQNANDAWIALGREMGFDGMTVRPASHDLEFTAEEAPVTRTPEKSAADLEYESWRPPGAGGAPPGLRLRAEFEAWTKRQPGDEMNLSGAQWGVRFLYADPITQAAWVGWQGAHGVGALVPDAGRRELTAPQQRCLQEILTNSYDAGYHDHLHGRQHRRDFGKVQLPHMVSIMADADRLAAADEVGVGVRDGL